jgi:hypothetical protein
MLGNAIDRQDSFSPSPLHRAIQSIVGQVAPGIGALAHKLRKLIGD